MAKNITIKDIASAVGVSHVTVSHALRNSPVVKEQTRQRILEVAAKMGYQPNFAAQSLINRSTRTLGIYVPPRPWSGLGHHYENAILIGIEKAAKQAGYDLMLINLTGDDSGEICVQKLAQRRVDGMMLIQPDTRASWVKELAQYTRHVVMIDPAIPSSFFRTILFDNKQAVKLAIEHLMELGHRRIGYLGTCLEQPIEDSQIRNDAFVEVAQELGLDIDPSWVHCGFDPKQPLTSQDHYCQIEGLRGARHLLRLPKANRPTAILCYNDLAAVHAIRHLSEHVDVPREMSVIGIDDSQWCFHSEPNLTSIRHPLEAMGDAAVKELVTLLQSKKSDSLDPDYVRVFSPELAIRSSTVAPPTDTRP